MSREQSGLRGDVLRGQGVPLEEEAQRAKTGTVSTVGIEIPGGSLWITKICGRVERELYCLCLTPIIAKNGTFLNHQHWKALIMNYNSQWTLSYHKNENYEKYIKDFKTFTIGRQDSWGESSWS